jgi:sensor c-di-GMP phosphodiesterase-like protein
MIQKIICVFLAFVMLCTSTPCYADPPVITPIAKGQAAPFAGVLLTPEAVAQIIATSSDCKRRIAVETEHATEIQKATDAKIIADAQADAERDRKIFKANIVSKDGQIKDLSEALKSSESARNNTWLWVSGGVLSGMLLAVGTVVIVNSAK